MKQKIEEILRKVITRETHKGSYQRVIIQTQEALLSLFTSEVERIIGKDEEETIPKLRDMPIEEAILRNELRKEQRLELQGRTKK